MSSYLISLLGLFPSLDSGAGFDPDIPTLGQIVEFAGNFAPRGWALAHGQLLPINQNQALFALLGTMYGGDGRTTFALPDFRGRTAIGSGGDFDVGERYGSDTIPLMMANLAAHDHTAPDDNQVPEPGSLALLFAGLASLGLLLRNRTRPIVRRVSR